MKHSPIIQENLDKLTTPKEKFHYLLYAYKEIITISIVSLILILAIGGSIIFNKQPDLSIRILNEQPMATESIIEIENTLKSAVSEDILISIDNYYNAEQLNLLMMQIAAKEIDFILFPETVSEDFYNLYAENVRPDEVFTLTVNQVKYKAYQTANAKEKNYSDQIIKNLSE